MRAVLVVSAVLLAGCLGNAEDQSGEIDTTADEAAGNGNQTAIEIPVTLTGCHGLELLSLGDAAELRPYVPDPFTIPDNPLIALGNFNCGDGNNVSERAFWGIQVTPPDELRSPREGDQFNYFWEPDHYNRPGTELARLFANAHATTDAVNTSAGRTMTGTSFHAAGDGFEWSWSGTGPALDGAWETIADNALLPFREYAAAEGGFAYLDADFGGNGGTAAPAVGTLTMSGTSPASDYYGTSSPQVGAFATEMVYEDAVVGYVPWP